MNEIAARPDIVLECVACGCTSKNFTATGMGTRCPACAEESRYHSPPVDTNKSTAAPISKERPGANSEFVAGIVVVCVICFLVAAWIYSR